MPEWMGNYNLDSALGNLYMPEKQGSVEFEAGVSRVRAILSESCSKFPDGSGIDDGLIKVVSRQIVSALYSEGQRTSIET